MRGSLRELTLERLGAIDHALVSPGFFRDSVVEQLNSQPEFARQFARAVPAIVLRGTAIHADSAARAHSFSMRSMSDSPQPPRER